MLLSLSHVATAIIVPKFQSLKEVSSQSHRIDPQLEQWLADLANKPLKPSKLDAYQSLLLELYEAKNLNIKQVFERYQNLQQKDPDHPLVPYVQRELLQIPNLNAQRKEEIIKQLLSGQFLSCPLKEVLLETTYKAQIVEQLAANISTISELSPSFHAQFLTGLFEGMGEKPTLALLPQIASLVTDNLPLKLKFPFLETTPNQLFKAQMSLAEIKEKLKSNSCGPAKAKLLETIKDYQTVLPQEQVLEVINDVAGCYRRLGKNQRYRYYQLMKDVPFLEVSSSLLVELEIAKLYWNEDKYQQAKTIVAHVIQKSDQKGFEDVSAKSHYLLARIFENEELTEQAVKQYTTFLELFPKHPRSLDVIRSMILIYVDWQKWDQVMDYSDKLLYLAENVIDNDESDEKVPFALFWLSRGLIEKQQIENSIPLLQRLAIEFYSTYYGALAHRMIEKMTGKIMVVAPQLPRPFDQNKIETQFNQAQRLSIPRIKALIAMGLQDEAQCEAQALEVAKGDWDQFYTKTLLLYSTGEWLSAIKSFVEIPREYRRSLPLGSERILFPQKYVDLIDEYAKRAKIDPDFVVSLVRQESVFNPMAHSAAGARGLMQLLKRTAYYQAKKLPPTYVSSQKKNRVLKSVKRTQNLFQVETNLILGIHYLKSLIDQYDNSILALAAYNAGPSVVKKWFKKYRTDDWLYFIEKIPYKETRSYVKLIMRNYFYYKRWYRQPDQDFHHFAEILDESVTLKLSNNKTPVNL